MIRHDDVETELGVLCAMRMVDGVSYLINLAREAPSEIHLFDLTDCGKKLSVVVAISAEAQTDLARRL